MIYGIGVTEGLGIANYFHSPGEGFQPAGMTQAQHVAGHLQVSAIGMIFLAVLAMIGFAVGRRPRSPRHSRDSRLKGKANAEPQNPRR